MFFNRVQRPVERKSVRAVVGGSFPAAGSAAGTLGESQCSGFSGCCHVLGRFDGWRGWMMDEIYLLLTTFF